MDLPMKYWFNFYYLCVVTVGRMWARNRETSIPWWKSVHERFRNRKIQRLRAGTAVIRNFTLPQ